MSRPACLLVCLAFTAHLVLAPTATGQSAPPPDTGDVYSQKSASRDGTGKVYMGREISTVMGHRGSNWLERPSREENERADLLAGFGRAKTS